MKLNTCRMQYIHVLLVLAGEEYNALLKVRCSSTTSVVDLFSYENAIHIQNGFNVFMIPCMCILPPLGLIQHSCTSYHCCRISLVVACVNRERPPSGGWRGLSCGNNILMRIRLFLLHDTV